MGKIDVTMLHNLTRDEFRALVAIELGMHNRELVSGTLIAYIGNLRHDGIYKLLQELSKRHLVRFRDGWHYYGYCLTSDGYDYLPLKVLVSQGIVTSFGNKLGVGKESSIYVVGNENGESLCLKLHRLRRTCFRRIKNERDYRRKCKSTSWPYLSQASATREFAYMKALKDRGFPVPKPIDFNRHCVIMELVDGGPLCGVHEVENVEELYDELMNLIVRLANHGVIHGGFNEFNILMTDIGKPIIIHFSQMVSTEHIKAEYFFERDVNCIRDFFKRRFGYESELYPSYKDVVREDCIDAEIEASGLTRRMENDVLVAMGLSEEDEDDDVSDNSQDNESIAKEKIIPINKDAEDIESLSTEISEPIAKDSCLKNENVHSNAITQSHELELKPNESINNERLRPSDRIDDAKTHDKILSIDKLSLGEKSDEDNAFLYT